MTESNFSNNNNKNNKTLFQSAFKEASQSAVHEISRTQKKIIKVNKNNNNNNNKRPHQSNASLKKCILS